MKQYADSIVSRVFVMFYDWFLDALRQDYELMRVIKESARGSIRLLRHRKTGKKFILRQFCGSPEVYRKLLLISCANLPDIYEVSTKGSETLVLEEYIEGDTLGHLLQGALFSTWETRDIVTQVCQALWVLHSIPWGLFIGTSSLKISSCGGGMRF